MLVAVRWGWGPGLFASIVANLTFNYFFVPPLRTFTVQEPRNALALLVFLGVAALISALLARAQAGETRARRGQEETALLYELSRVIIARPDARDALSLLCARVRETFTVEYCAVLKSGSGGLHPVAWSGPAEARPVSAYERRAAEDAFSTGMTVFLGQGEGRRRPRIVGIRDRHAPTAYVPLRVGALSVGVLQAAGRLEARVFTNDDLRLLDAFADEAALALDRDRLLHEAARAEALQETDRLRAALLMAVSHDLRTPLTSILTAASSLLQEDIEWDAETRREFLSSIESQALRLSRLVSNLLDLSRIEGGALHPDADWYDVREMLEDALEGSARALVRHRIQLEVAPDVGEALFDRVQISQVVTNLLENAAKFAPAETAITLAAQRRAGAVEITITDQGPGIPLAERARVFEKFYRLPEMRAVPGTGIGLAISKGLVEAHDGRIELDEAPGGGARFVVTLPVTPRPEPSLALSDGGRS